MRHICPILLLFIVFVSCSSPEPVEIPDANLAAVIREVLNLDEDTPIKEKELIKIEKLNASNSQISNLTGIEKMTGLYRDIT